ncbi:undecaprenyl/decaprenyl-phosphate alpha-N-acetylglucosaminyl 1-phosphate transferase [bacterium]|nr:undecaprenyl/decaprenyl-phosphate alpha-N-acetylglucosaminyl 1-phosphate transferase [bacterium]
MDNINSNITLIPIGTTTSIFVVMLSFFAWSFILTAILIPICRKISHKLKLLDKPSEPRKIHSSPKALLGGVGIYFTFQLAIFALWKFFPIERTKLVSIFIGGTILMLTGLIDDIRPLTAKAKLFWQVLASTLAAFLLISSDIKISGYLEKFDMGIPIAYAITIIWIIGITNSFNLLDNMDGLSSGIAFICSLTFAVIALMQAEIFTALVALSISGACLGFIPYNWSPSSIFMGDAGSMFVGFIIATLSIMGVYRRLSEVQYIPILAPLIILAVPMFDTLSVIIIRLKSRISIFNADKNHFSHRLVNLGMSTRQAVGFNYLVCFVMGLMGILVTTLTRHQATIIIFLTISVFMIIVFLMNISDKQIKTFKENHKHNHS